MSIAHYINEIAFHNDKRTLSSAFSYVVDIEAARGQLSSLNWITLSADQHINKELKKALFNSNKHPQGIHLDTIRKILIIDAYLIPSELHINSIDLNELVLRVSSENHCEVVLLYGYEAMTTIHSKSYIDFLGYKQISEDSAVMVVSPNDAIEIDFPVTPFGFDIVE